jgi:hypothetical protein
VDVGDPHAELLGKGAHSILPRADELPAEIDRVTAKIGRKGAAAHAVPRLKDDSGGAALPKAVGCGESRKARPYDDHVQPLSRTVCHVPPS